MTKLPLGLAALLAAAFAVAGCASKRVAGVVPPPVADFPVKPAEVKPDAFTERPPGWSATQVTASARYVRISGAIPEAKGALAFLTDEAALRAGTLTLTKAQADAALEELTRVTQSDVRSTPTVTVAEGNPAKISVGTHPSSESKAMGVTVSIGGVEHEFQTRDVGVSLEFTPHAFADGAVQIDAEIQVTAFEGFVEYGSKQVVVPTKTNLSGEVLESVTVKVPDGFYQPIFSTNSVRRELRIPKEAVVVLLADPVKKNESSSDKEGPEKPLLGSLVSRRETWLIFLTAEVVPTKH